MLHTVAATKYNEIVIIANYRAIDEPSSGELFLKNHVHRVADRIFALDYESQATGYTREYIATEEVTEINTTFHISYSSAK